jgi:hypothetical protein
VENELLVLEQDMGFTLAFDFGTQHFDVFKGEHLERSFEALEDAQDSFWTETQVSKMFPAFDW